MSYAIELFYGYTVINVSLALKMKKEYLQMGRFNVRSGVLLCLLCAIAYVVLFSSCNKDSNFNGTNPNIEFSIDTLRFDTVFTTQGSATRFIKIFNRENETVLLDRIAMQESNSSFFRLNIDGTAGNEISNIEIKSLDSIYVFAEVTIDPDAPLSSSPFIIEEYLEVQYQDQIDEVLFEAWGQNANYINSRDAAGNISFLTCDFDEIILDDPKPYIIHGVLVIDSCDLIIAPGTEIYVHGGIAINDIGVYNDGLITVLENGSIQAFGTAEDPIIIQGDRLEEGFKEVSGQWVGLRFFNNSKDNVLSHTTVKNSIIGVRVDSSAQLLLSSSKILNTSSSGLIGVHSEIIANNSLFYNNGTNAVQFAYGGDYRLNHCTLYNDNNQDAALSATNFACQDPACELPLLLNPLELSIENSIISGTNEDELLFIDAAEGMDQNLWKITMNHTIIRAEEFLDNPLHQDLINNCVKCDFRMSTDSLFLDRDNYDLRLDTMSVAIDAGRFNGLMDDIDGNFRDIFPDLGCYEFIK